MASNFSNVYKKFELAYSECLKSSDNINHLEDDYTKQHSNRVASYAVLIGQKLDLDEESLDILRIGGLFHDIGKTGVSTNILFKDSSLNNDEFSQMKKHTYIGSDILGHSPVFNNIIPIVKYHHEKYDGNGYPEGLKGNEIPLFARIISIADTFDAMTSTRSYRNALPIEVAKEEIKRCSGSQFDPEIVNAFLDILNDNLDEVKDIQKNIYKKYI